MQRLVLPLFFGLVCPASASKYCGSLNCYSVLSVDPSADLAAIKKSYRKLSLQWHPDKNPANKEEATQRFQEIATAYEVLSDEAMREAYDYYLAHPEEHLYNTMRYYKAACTPKTPLWAVALGLLAVTSCLQYVNWREQAKAFERSPAFRKLVEEQSIKRCPRGRQGYQMGELTSEKGAALCEELLQELRSDPHCPLSWPRWSNTALPTVLFHLPLAAARWVAWRVANHREISDEKSRLAEEQRQEEEELLEEEEEENKRMAEKQAQKAANAERQAERKRLEEEKKRRWAEEAARDLAEQRHSASEPLTITGKVQSSTELRKKGHFLVEVVHGSDEVVQLVVDRPVTAGQEATVALEGATLDSGDEVQRCKIAGEWSEAVLLALADPPPEASAPEGEVDEVMASDAAVPSEPAPEGSAPAAGKSAGRPRKRK
mmetsp:Transcript_33379/g.95885  ORF Transcript_33379/g.95885 Transcript_33379/m.95885 type:complete len:432 (+) Transcript_33379:162-1457(+)